MTMPDTRGTDENPQEGSGSSNLDELSPEARAFVRRNLADLFLSLYINERSKT